MAGIAPLPLVAPGSLGLNTEDALTLLDPRYATEAFNAVIGADGRLGARAGWVDKTTGPISGGDAIDVLHEYVNESGTTRVLAAANNKIYFTSLSTFDFTNVSIDITPATTPTGDDWNFQNFNGSVLGFQDGHTPIIYSGSSDFADISAGSGTLPTGGAALCAFGRVWCVDNDGQTIKYSALLDETLWDSTDGAGSIDMSSVWTDGTDVVVAIAAFGANLVVFGKRHIILWTDGAGSDIGIDPDNIYVVDTIEGTGCIARDSVQKIGEGDMAFLSPNGVQLLGRVIKDRANPMATISKKIRDRLLEFVNDESDLLKVRSAYHEKSGRYILLLPDARRQFVFHMNRLYTDANQDLLAPVTEWSIGPSAPKSVCVRLDNSILFGFDGRVGQYDGTKDNESSYEFLFKSGWLNLGQQAEARLKILKQLRTLLSVSGSLDITYSWGYDFGGLAYARTLSPNVGTPAYYGLGEYNVSEFGAVDTLVNQIVSGAGAGQYLQFAIEAEISESELNVQQATLLPKLGRLA